MDKVRIERITTQPNTVRAVDTETGASVTVTAKTPRLAEIEARAKLNATAA